MATNEMEPRDRPESGWALGGIIFAASIMILIGVYQFLMGLVAIVNDEFFVIAPNYTYDVDVTGWGWIHLIVGIIVAAGGIGLFYRKLWAAALAIALAGISAIVNFFFIPYYPFWSILIIALNVFVIWAITRPGAIEV
jgi:hypothetical protein